MDGVGSLGLTDKSMKESSKRTLGTVREHTDTPVEKSENSCGTRVKSSIVSTPKRKRSIELVI